MSTNEIDRLIKTMRIIVIFELTESNARMFFFVQIKVNIRLKENYHRRYVQSNYRRHM